MEDQVEAGIVKNRKVCHVSLHDSYVEVFAVGHELVAGELLIGIVETGDVCPGRGEQRHLLAAT
jgi:hypothetical protein